MSWHHSVSVAKDFGDWTWKWAPYISQIYDYLFSWDLLGRIPWNTALDRTRIQESWLFFRGHVSQAQELTVPNTRRLSETARGWKRSSQQNSAIKKKPARGESRDKGAGGNMISQWLCRDVVRKAEVHLELNLTRDMKGNKKGFYGQFSSMKGKCKVTSD